MSTARDRPAVDLADLAAHLDEILEPERFSDYGPNGLQVEGRSPVEKLVSGVSACHELFERAAAARADCVLVHHGLFWKGDPRELTGFRYRRVAALIESGIGLLAYHLPLDAHAELGNNAVAAERLGLVDREPWGQLDGMTIGFSGRFPEPIPAADLVARCHDLYGQAPLAFTAGPEEVATVGIISGGAQKGIYAAVDAGLDAFITGEASEWVMNIAREAGVHFLAAGHYATERLGVQALGEHVAERFGVEVEFVDVPNPV